MGAFQMTSKRKCKIFVKNLAIFLFTLLIMAQFGCKAHRVYMQKYSDPLHPELRYDLKFESVRDTQYVQVRYTGDFGKTTGVYYKLKLGLPDGHYKIFIDNSLKESEVYENGKKNGKGTKYYNDDTYSDFVYKNDTLSGVAILHFPNGLVKQRSFFSYGHLILVSSYNLQSEVIGHDFYLNDIPIRTEKFNYQDGTITIKDNRNNSDNKVLHGVKLNGQKSYNYPKGSFIALYKNNEIIECKWIRTSMAFRKRIGRNL